MRGAGAVHADAAGAQRAGRGPRRTAAGSALPRAARPPRRPGRWPAGSRSRPSRRAAARAARCPARRAPGCGPGRRGRSGPGPTSAAGWRRGPPGRRRSGRRCGDGGGVPRGDERVGELRDLRSDRKVGVHESSFVCRLRLVTPARMRGQRQHEERQRHAVSGQHSMAWRLVWCAGMRAITSQATLRCQIRSPAAASVSSAAVTWPASRPPRWSCAAQAAAARARRPSIAAPWPARASVPAASAVAVQPPQVTPDLGRGDVRVGQQ